LLVIAVAIPLLLVSLIVMLDHWDIISTSLLTRLPWQLNVAILSVPGLVPVACLRWPAQWRIVCGLVFFVGMFALLPLFGLVFSCTFTGDCI
jgi:hypothetical protein